MLLTKPKFAHHFDFCPVIFEPEPCDVLLCVFGPIVPGDVLRQCRQAFNVHPGPITYPGRDPHHWAIHEGAEWFGVTLHFMRERVDEGTVIRTEPFRIETDDPIELRDEANRRAIRMMQTWGPRLLDGTYIFPTLAEDWCGPKHTRAQAIAMADHPAFHSFRRA